MRLQRWQRGLFLVAGGWMLCSPLVLPTYDAAEPVAIWASHANGAMLLMLGSAALATSRPWLDWASLGAAGWLIASPWVLGFSSLSGVATSNHILVGILVGLIALALIASHREDSAAAHVEQH
jgi:hypothetical protein